VTASGSSSQYVWLEALARALTVVAPISVGVYALHRGPFQRFGAMLVLAGVVWFLTTLTNSESELLYSVGRVAAWVVEPLLLYLLLAFPSGRLEHRIDRWLVAAMVLMLVVLYLPTHRHAGSRRRVPALRRLRRGDRAAQGRPGVRRVRGLALAPGLDGRALVAVHHAFHSRARGATPRPSNA
jgi:hypothetical protein